MNARELILLVAIGLAAGVHADVFGTGTNGFTIDFVDIRAAGNTVDTRTGYGSVGYDYRIGRTEITIAQFIRARTADSRIGDGDENFWNDGARTVGTNAPASMVSWYEAAKFCNWLTSGDAYTGAYRFDGSGVLTAMDRDAALATYETVYVLPTEHEWYKAAYYKPVNDGSYSLFAHGLDTPPLAGTTNGWNYASVLPEQIWETGFGGVEQNGTYDMNGNVWEWNENLFYWPPEIMRPRRGGSYFDSQYPLRSTTRDPDDPASEYGEVGFRVAAIPGTPSIRMFIDAGTSSQMELGWSSTSGETYQVQYSTNLVSTNWFNLGGSMLADGPTNYLVDPTGDVTQRFYRVLLGNE